MIAPVTASFAAACGQLRPLRLAVEHADGGRIAEGELDQPHALIGSGEGCEIALNHPDVPARAAVLQVLDGEMFAIALDGSAVRRLSPETPFVLGPFTVRLFAPPSDNPPRRIADPLRDRATNPDLPRIRLTRLLRESVPKEIDRRFTFLGPTADPLAYLTLTPDGLFVTDLRGGDGTFVNGQPVRVSPLTDGDELRVGAERYAVAFAGPDPLWEQAPTAAVGRVSEALLGGGPLGLREPDDALVPLVQTTPAPVAAITLPATLDPDLVAILQQVGGLQGQLIDQFRRTVEGMLADFGNLQREQLAALRDEMARMSEVTAQLARLRGEAGVTLLPPQPVGTLASVPAPTAATAAPPVSEESAAVHMAVFDRLTGMERERPGLWKRLRGLLGGRGE